MNLGVLSLDRIFTCNYYIMRCTIEESLCADRIVDARAQQIHVASRGRRELLPDSTPVIDLVDQIRRLPGSGSIRSGGDAWRPPARVGSIVISGSDRRGWRGIWTQKEPERAIRPRRISLSSFPLAIFLYSHLFFPITFHPSPPTPIFLLPENQSDARCNARYEAPGRSASPLYGLRPRSPKFRKKGSGNNKTRGTSCAPFHAGKKTDLGKKGVNDGLAKGDTFRFLGVQGNVSLLLSFPGSFHDSPVFVRRIMRIRSHVSRAVARERL